MSKSNNLWIPSQQNLKTKVPAFQKLTFVVGSSFKQFSTFYFSIFDKDGKNIETHCIKEFQQVSDKQRSFTIITKMTNKQGMFYNYKKIADKDISPEETGKRPFIKNKEAKATDEWNKQNLSIKLILPSDLEKIRLGLFEAKTITTIISQEKQIDLTQKNPQIKISFDSPLMILKFSITQKITWKNSIAEFVIAIKDLLPDDSNQLVFELDETKVRKLVDILQVLNRNNVSECENNLFQIISPSEIKRMYLEDAIDFDKEREQLLQVNNLIQEANQQFVYNPPTNQNLNQQRLITKRKSLQQTIIVCNIQQQAINQNVKGIADSFNLVCLNIKDFTSPRSEFQQITQFQNKDLSTLQSSQNNEQETLEAMEQKIKQSVKNQEDLQQTLDQFKKKVLNLKEDIKKKKNADKLTNKQIEQQEKQIQDLQELIKKLLQQIDDFQNQLKSFQYLIQELQESNSQYQTKINYLENQNINLQSLIKNMGQNYNNLFQQLEILRPHSPQVQVEHQTQGTIPQQQSQTAFKQQTKLPPIIFQNIPWNSSINIKKY